jgi:hypothetical protein
LNTLAISVVVAYALQCKKDFELHGFDWRYSTVYVAHSHSSQEITRRLRALNDSRTRLRRQNEEMELL